MREFEWDPEKSERNLEKHGIDFFGARSLWRGPVCVEGTYSGTDQRRWKVHGLIGGRHWTAIVTCRHGVTRIISVRRSRKDEVELYDRFRGRQEERDGGSAR